MIFLSGTVLRVRNISQKETHNKVAAIFLYSYNAHSIISSLHVRLHNIRNKHYYYYSLQMEMLKLGWLLALDLKYEGLAKFTDDW